MAEQDETGGWFGPSCEECAMFESHSVDNGGLFKNFFKQRSNIRL